MLLLVLCVICIDLCIPVEAYSALQSFFCSLALSLAASLACAARCAITGLIGMPVHINWI